MILRAPRFAQTNRISCPNIYVQMLPDYKGWIYIDDEAASLRGKWREQYANPSLPLDLEIGCGTGFFFEHLAKTVPQRNHLGIEIKYKPLVQTARRVRKIQAGNAKVIRYHAKLIDDLFAPGELDNVHIHFPDPWTRKKQNKHRLLDLGFFAKVHGLQRPGSWIDFKTDSKPYFESVREIFSGIPYEVVRYTEDLHQSEWKSENFETGFEKIFLRQRLPIYYCRLLRKPEGPLEPMAK